MNEKEIYAIKNSKKRIEKQAEEFAYIQNLYVKGSMEQAYYGLINYLPSNPYQLAEISTDNLRLSIFLVYEHAKKRAVTFGFKDSTLRLLIRLIGTYKAKLNRNVITFDVEYYIDIIFVHVLILSNEYKAARNVLTQYLVRGENMQLLDIQKLSMFSTMLGCRQIEDDNLDLRYIVDERVRIEHELQRLGENQSSNVRKTNLLWLARAQMEISNKKL